MSGQTELDEGYVNWSYLINLVSVAINAASRSISRGWREYGADRYFAGSTKLFE